MFQSGKIIMFVEYARKVNNGQNFKELFPFCCTVVDHVVAACCTVLSTQLRRL